MKGFLLLTLIGFANCPAPAQENNIQVHGFATQSFVYSGSNNYLGMNTSSGSFGWTEGALNLNDQLSSKLRIGVQFHVTRLGQFGDSTVGVDWALADYRVNRWLGVRAGKVKIRWGLYNDRQDADPGYTWSLLPEPIYAVDLRATNLSQLGVELYGRTPLPRRFGSLEYSAYYGHYTYASNDGYMELYRQSGWNFSDAPDGKTPGFDLRWKPAIPGVTLGGSLMLYDARGNLVNGAFRQPLTYWPTYYAQYDRKKLNLAWQYMKLVQYTNVAASGEPPLTSLSDTRASFVMGSYRVTNKLQAGVYYSRYVVASAQDKSDAANYSRDWVVSGRYDLNPYLYLKMEGHFIDGTGVGFYAFNNPNGLSPQTRLLVAKLGFSF